MGCKLNGTVRTQSDGPVTALGVGDWGHYNHDETAVLVRASDRSKSRVVRKSENYS